MRVELSLSPELASQVARGAQLVVHHSNGKATLQIIPVGEQASGGGQQMVLNLPDVGGLPEASEAAGGGQASQAASEGAGESAVSDEDMISALIGCAHEKASAALDGGLSNQDGMPAQGDDVQLGDDDMSDEALALALAGCVRADGAEGERGEEGEGEEGCEFGVCEAGEVPVWYQDEEEHHDLDMTLFGHDA